MTTPTDLERRLSEAKEGSRELDEAILHALNVEHSCEYHSLNLTTSIDKAVTLAEAVLPGIAISLGDIRGRAIEMGHPWWRAFLNDHGPSGKELAKRYWEAEQRTPALALCLAIVRALKEKA